MGREKPVLDGFSLSCDDVVSVAYSESEVDIDSRALDRSGYSRSLFEDLVSSGVPIYGVTTGYGEMVYVSISSSQETTLQTNLVCSHSTGTGPVFSRPEARSMMLARLNSLVRGYSAVRPELLLQISSYLNAGITPMIPEIGSLGASGDLGPLAHFASTLIGEGYVLDGDCKQHTVEKLQELGLDPLILRFKEGLSLINGTSAMTGLTALLISDAYRQVKTAEILAAMVVEILRGSSSAFLPEGHDIARPHPGQIDSAWNMRMLLSGSSLIESHKSLRTSIAKLRGDSNEEIEITNNTKSIYASLYTSNSWGYSGYFISREGCC